MKNYVVISCHMIENELLNLMEKHHVSWPVYFIPPDLHGDMDKLRDYLQNIIDSIKNVDGIVLTISRCGNATVGLKASSAPLILPRGADCIDLMLSEKRLEDRKRPVGAIFATESWVENMESTDFSFTKLCEKHGEETAEAMMKAMYDNYKYYYILDTGTFDTELLAEYIAPQAEMLEMEIKTVPCRCGALEKLVKEEFDEDFLIVPPGETIRETDFIIM